MSTMNTNENLFVGSDSCSNSDSISSDMVLSDSGITAPGISDPVFMHFSRTLTIRELVDLKKVSETFSNLVSKNSAITARVRREDNAMDWYYPLYMQTRYYRDESHGNPPDGIVPGLLFGVHRPSGEFHNLPSYSHFLPHRASYHPQDVHASVEGLLLMMLENPDPSNWKPLVVTNPVTEEWRLLPAPDCTTLGLTSWNYGTFQLRMIADKKANAYKVILIQRKSLCVYKSTTNTWISHILSARFPFGIRCRGRRDAITECYKPSSSVVNGRIHFADLEYDNDAQPKAAVQDNLNLLARGQVRVYEVDDEAGTWKPCVQYKLQSYFPSNLYRDYKDYGFWIGSYQVGIVECMGCMYAIIPDWLNIFENIDEEFKQFHELGPTYLKYIDCGIQKLRFYILRLEGSVGRPFGHLLIEDSGDGAAYNINCFLQHDRYASSHTWYRCFARGGVIWVVMADYMLQYDVLSGGSTTEVLQKRALGVLRTKQNVAFTPSLYAKP